MSEQTPQPTRMSPAPVARETTSSAPHAGMRQHERAAITGDSRRCTATRVDGSPCQAWAVRTTDPPRCSAHGGKPDRGGAPPGNTNAFKHGYYARPSTVRRIAASAAADQGPEPAESQVPAPTGAPVPGEAEVLVPDGIEALIPGGVEGHVPSGIEGWSIETIIVDLSIKRALLSRYIDACWHHFTVQQIAGLLRIHGQNASRLGRLLRHQQALTGGTDALLEEALNRALDEVGEELGIEL